MVAVRSAQSAIVRRQAIDGRNYTCCNYVPHLGVRGSLGGFSPQQLVVQAARSRLPNQLDPLTWRNSWLSLPSRRASASGRHFTTEGVHPYDELEWDRRDARITNFRDGSVAFEQLGVEFPVDLVAERHEHRRPEVLPGHARHARARVVAAPGGRPGRRHDHPVGRRGRLLRRRRRGRRLQRRAQAPAGHPEGGLQQPRVVQHRRQGRAPAGERVLHPLGRRHAWTRSSTGTERRASSSRAARAPASTCPASARRSSCCKGGGTASGPGQLHAGRRRLGRHDQVGRQDPARRQDGHPRRRPPRHRGVHLVQGARGAQGPGARAGRLRHGPRRPRQPLASSTRTPTTRSGSPTSSCRRSWTTATGACARSPPARSFRTVKARELFRQIAQAAWECADPGMQFDTTINHWHTAANTGRINGSNPCSEYMHLDDSACNLASLNLLKFLDDDDSFDVDGFRHAVEVMFTGQEILVGRADYPTEADRRHVTPVPPARPRLRQPRRAADGARPALRQRRRPGLRAQRSRRS